MGLTVTMTAATVGSGVGYKSFGNLCDAVEAITGNTTTGAALPLVQSAYERVLGGQDPRDEAIVHTWSFLQPIAALTISKHTTGTATGVYAAGTGLTTITATTALFVPSQVGLAIDVTDIDGALTDASLTIASYTSSTVIVATGGEDFAAKAVSLPHSGMYALPSDFAGLIEAPVYPWPNGESVWDFEEAAPETIFAEWRDTQTAGAAVKYAIVAASQVAGAKQTYLLIVSPKPSSDRILRYRYRAAPADATDDPTKYPLGGPLMGPVYEAAVKAEAEIAGSQGVGRWEARFRGEMVSAIARDKAFFSTEDLELRQA